VRRILIIDDDQDIVLFLSTFLEDEGYTITVAFDGRHGLDLAREQRPDLVLLDLQMPGTTGVGFYREFGNDPALRDIPVLIVTGVREFDLFANGCRPARPPFAVLDKPINREDLLATIRRALDGRPPG
jgi:CheY-like chemotaxis protein